MKRLVLVILALLGILLLGLILALHTQLLQGATARGLTRWMSRELGQPVELGSFRLGWTGLGELRDLRIGAPGREWLLVPRCDLKLDAGELMHRRVRAQWVEIQGGSVRLLFEPDGSDNLPAGDEMLRVAVAPTRSSEELDRQIQEIVESYTCGRIRLVDCSFLLELPEEDLTVEVPRIDARLEQGANPPGTYQVRIDLGDSRVEITDILDVQGSMTLEGMADGGGARIDQVQFTSSRGGAEVTAGPVQVDRYPDPIIEGRVNGRVEHRELARILRSELPLEGEIRLDGRVGGPARSLWAQAVLRTDRLLLQGIPLEEVTARAAWDGREAVLESLTGRIAGGSFTGTGVARVEGRPALEAAISVRDGDLARVLSRLTDLRPGPLDSWSDWALRAEEMKPEAIRLSGNLWVRSAPAPGQPPLELTAQLAGGLEAWTAPRMELRCGPNRLRMEGLALDIQGNLEGVLQGSLPEPELLARALSRVEPSWSPPELPELDGALEVQGRLSGRLPSPGWTGTLQGTGIRYGPVDLGHLSVLGSLQADGLDLTRLRLDGGAGRIEAAGRVSWTEAFPETPGSLWNGWPGLDLDLTCQGLDLEPWGAVLASDLQAVGKVSGEASLRLGGEGGATGRLLLGAEDVSLAGQPIPMASIRGLADPSGLALEGLQISLGTGRLFGQGSWTGEGARGRLYGDLDLNEIQLLQELDFRGTVRLESELAWIEESPRGELTLELTRLGRGAARDLGEAELTGRLQDGELHWSGTCLGETGRLSGRFGLGGTAPFRIEIDLEESDLAVCSALAGAELPSLTGRISAEAVVAGELTDPEGISVQGIVQGVDAALEGYSATVTDPFPLRYDPEGLVIGPARLAGEIGRLLVNLEGGEGGTLAGVIDGELDLAILPRLVPEITAASGRCWVDLTLGGTLEAPTFQGELSVEELQLEESILGQRVEDFHAGIRVENRLLVLDYALGLVADSEVDLRGQLGLSETGGFLDLAVEGESLTFHYPSGLRSELDLDLSLVGPLDSLLLQGDVLVRDALYSKRVDYRTMIVEESRAVLMFRQRETAPEEEAEPGQEGAAIRLALRIQAPGSVRVLNNLADLELAADLDLVGDTSRPNLVGRVDVTEGTITYSDREFDIQNATLDFLDPDEINPYLDLTASARIQSYEVQLSLSGYLLGELTPIPSSDPPLGEVDLWSLIVLGRTTEQLSGAGDLAASEAASLLTGQLQDELEKRIKLIGGFDDFSIDPIFSDTSDSASARFTFKKRVGDRLTVTYSTTASSTGEQLVIAEYEVSDGLKIMGERTEEGSLGADLRFRLEFD